MSCRPSAKALGQREKGERPKTLLAEVYVARKLIADVLIADGYQMLDYS